MKILHSLHKIHSLLFYKLVRFVLRLDSYFMEIPDMGWVMNKALFALFCIQAIWILTSWTVLEIIIKRTIPDLFEEKTIWNLLCIMLLFSFNYFTLIYKKDGLNTMKNLQHILKQKTE